MKASEAKQLAQKINQPKIEQFLKEHPIEHLLDKIKEAANNGFVGINYGMPFNAHHAPVTHVATELVNLGYQVEMLSSVEDGITNYNLKIKWDK